MRKSAVALLVGGSLLVAAAGVGTVVLFQLSTKSEDETFGVPWAPYTPSGGLYTISFPRKPNESWTPDARPPVTHIVQYRLIHDPGDDEVYTVEVTPLPKVGDVEKELDAAVDEGAQGMTVVSQSKITLNGKYPGRAATLKDTQSNPVVNGKMRVYIVDGRRYLLHCVGVEDDANVERFFDSFKLAKSNG